VKTLSKIGEQISDFSRSIFSLSWGSSAIRSVGRVFSFSFWSDRRPQRTEVNYAVTRQLYRNEGDYAYGSGFAKPIVDLQVGFIGLPLASTDNESTNEFLNECLTNYWVDEIQQMFRDTIRDSKCIVRIQRPDILDPLMTLDEAEHCALEIIPPELVEIERNVANKRIIERAVIRHSMTFVKDDGDVASGQDPTIEDHDVLEVITPRSYRFFDQTDSVWLTDLQRENRDNFVPLLEVYNEWDASMNSGQKDVDNVLTFLNAF
jgi:hypothetical protein